MDIDILKRGAVAGFVGAMVVVLWFLGVDLVRGEPLATPAFVASALLGGSALAAVPAYTILHFMSFQVVGTATSWAMDRLGVVAPTLLGLAVGFLLFDLIFYGSVLSTGADVVAELGWPPVLVGNFLAGLAVTHTIHRMQGERRGGWLSEALQGPVVREGITVGLVGASAVALWFLIVDAAQGQALLTPSALGGLLLAGETGAAAMGVNMTWVVGYTLVHFGVFIGLGILLAAVAATGDETPPLVLGTFLAFVTFEALVMGVVALLSQFLPHAWWTVAGANLLAAVAMGALLWARHPSIARALSSDEVLVAAE